MTALGQALKEEREKRDISLEEIASTTKIVPRYLEALENDRFDILPGGFFIKGIIRSYARAIGLDPDEVLARYRSAGVFGGSEPKRNPFLRPSPSSACPAAAVPAAEPVLPSEASTPAPSAVETPGPEPDIEEAPQPRLSAAARKRIFSWTWRSLAVVAAVAVLVTLWSNRRPRPPEDRIETAAPVPATVVAGPALPAAAGREPGTQAPAQPEAAEVLSPAPGVEEVRKGITIEIAFQTETRISVTADGTLQIDGVFPPGATARAQADGILVITTGNAGGFTFSLNGRPAKPLGRSGQILNDVKITPENIKDFLEGQAPGPAAG